jgi:hypothetical protein
MKRGAMDHPKLQHLCSLLNLEKFEAVGILETVWHFTAKYAPKGDIGRFTDEEIAKWVGWSRRSGQPGVTSGSRLVDALVTSRWVDRSEPHRLVVHDWADHADQTLKRFLASRNLAFVQHGANPPAPEARGQKPAPAPAAVAPASYRNGSLTPAVSPPPTDTLTDSHRILKVRGLLHEYVTHLCHLDWPPPDDQICTHVLLAAGGDVEELQQKLIVLWKQKHAQPNRSYAWFISSVRSVK